MTARTSDSMFYPLTMCALQIVFMIMIMLKVISALSVLFIVISILSFCLKTHHTMKIPVVRNATFQRFPVGGGNDVTCRRGVTSSRQRREECSMTSDGGGGVPAWMLERLSTRSHQAFFYTECVCNAWFSLELCIRFIVSPSRLQFLRTPVNVIDIVATASFYLDFIMTQLQQDHDVLEFFRYMYFTRRYGRSRIGLTQ